MISSMETSSRERAMVPSVNGALGIAWLDGDGLVRTASASLIFKSPGGP